MEGLGISTKIYHIGGIIKSDVIIVLKKWAECYSSLYDIAYI